jgi:hypothetical protein
VKPYDKNGNNNGSDSLNGMRLEPEGPEEIDKREKSRRYHGRKRNVLRKAYNEYPDKYAYAANGRVKHEHRAERNRNTLAALEVEVDGESVAEHTSDACDIRITVAGHKNKTEDRGNDCLENITEKRDDRRALAVCAKHIRHTGIAAAVRAHVVAVAKLGNDNAEIKAAEKIRNDNAENYAYYEERRVPVSDETFCEKFLHNFYSFIQLVSSPF